VVKYFDSLVLLILKDSVEFQTISVKLCKVQWSEIFIVPLIDKDVVNIEKERFWHIFRRIRKAIPIQTVYIDITV
jgi:hypothetical protein